MSGESRLFDNYGRFHAGSNTGPERILRKAPKLGLPPPAKKRRQNAQRLQSHFSAMRRWPGMKRALANRPVPPLRAKCQPSESTRRDCLVSVPPQARDLRLSRDVLSAWLLVWLWTVSYT